MNRKRHQIKVSWYVHILKPSGKFLSSKQKSADLLLRIRELLFVLALTDHFFDIRQDIIKTIQELLFIRLFKDSTAICIYYTMRRNLLNWCNLVSISKKLMFYAFGVVRIYWFVTKKSR
jgi:hypothetical protein